MASDPEPEDRWAHSVINPGSLMMSLRTPSRYAYTHPNVNKYHVSCRSPADCASSIQQIPEIKDVLYLDPPSIRRERASQPAAVRIRANGGGSRCAPPFRGGATCVHAELRRLPYDLSSTLYFSSVPPNLALEEIRIEGDEHLDAIAIRRAARTAGAEQHERTTSGDGFVGRAVFFVSGIKLLDRCSEGQGICSARHKHSLY